jgi:hypothetical protein
MAGIRWTDRDQMSATCNPDHKQRLKRQEDSLARALEQAEAAQEMSARISARFARLAGRSERRQRQMAHLSLLEASLALLEEGNDILSQRLTALEELTIQQQGELRDIYKALGEMNATQSLSIFRQAKHLASLVHFRRIS